MTYDGIINISNELLLQAYNLLEATCSEEARALRRAAEILRDNAQELIELEKIKAGEVALSISEDLTMISGAEWREHNESEERRYAELMDRWKNRVYNRELALDYVRQVAPDLWGAMQGEFVFMEGYQPEAHYERGA